MPESLTVGIVSEYINKNIFDGIAIKWECCEYDSYALYYIIYNAEFLIYAVLGNSVFYLICDFAVYKYLCLTFIQ